MKFNDLSLQWKTIENDALPGILAVLNTGNFILGSSVGEFETEFAKWNGNSYAIGVANGTDALKICIASLSLKGKTKFYVPSNTYIATLLGVVFSMVENYEYELVDCDEYYQIDCSLLEKSIQSDHKKYDNLVVMPVHLYGHCCDMKKLMSLKKKYNFKMVEDCFENKTPFWKIFLNMVDINEIEGSGASEYELYFTYMYLYHPNDIFIRQLNWENLTNLHNSSRNNDFVSIHWFSRE